MDAIREYKNMLSLRSAQQNDTKNNYDSDIFKKDNSHGCSFE